MPRLKVSHREHVRGPRPWQGAPDCVKPIAPTMTPPTASLPFVFGDLQGCHAPFRRLLAALPTENGTPPLWFVGDLVNRGPDSLATLREVAHLGQRARVVLGNHDLHLLAVAAGIRPRKPGDTLDDILAAPDAGALLEWLRHRPVAHFENEMLMVHAGVLPQWDVALTLELADELQRALRAPDWARTLAELFSQRPLRWSLDLPKADRMRVALSALTRLRFCSSDGTMDFSANGTLETAPLGCFPWFEVPERRTEDATIAFGHWAALGLMIRERLIAVDSGCVWGNRLSAVQLSTDMTERIVIQVECTDCSRQPDHRQKR